MTDYERRDNVSLTAVITTLEMMNDKLDKIDNSIHDKGGISERITTVEANGLSTQKEITEHKSNHWQQAFIIIGVSGIVATIAVVFIPFFLNCPK